MATCKVGAVCRGNSEHRAPPPRFGGGGGSTDSGSTFQAEVSWHKSGQVLHFGFKNSVLGPQHTFPLVAVLLKSCAITIFPSTSKKISSSVSLHAVFAPYKAGKAVALVVYALCWHLGGPRFNPSFPWLGKIFTFAAVVNLMQLSNAHTKCMETLTLNTLDTRHTAFVGAFVGTWY